MHDSAETLDIKSLALFCASMCSHIYGVKSSENRISLESFLNFSKILVFDRFEPKMVFFTNSERIFGW